MANSVNLTKKIGARANRSLPRMNDNKSNISLQEATSFISYLEEQLTKISLFEQSSSGHNDFKKVFGQVVKPFLQRLRDAINNLTTYSSSTGIQQMKNFYMKQIDSQQNTITKLLQATGRQEKGMYDVAETEAARGLPISYTSSGVPYNRRIGRPLGGYKLKINNSKYITKFEKYFKKFLISLDKINENKNLSAKEKKNSIKKKGIVFQKRIEKLYTSIKKALILENKKIKKYLKKSIKRVSSKKKTNGIKYKSKPKKNVKRKVKKRSVNKKKK